MTIISPDELKHIGAEMFRYLDYVCRQNGIKYYMMFGTLIGTIRHHGYIPWDDDIDIAMFREDYNKFIRIVQEEGKYQYIGMENDPNYYFTYGRLTDKRTILKHRPKRKIADFGIFIDLFPIDNAPTEAQQSEWRKEFLDKKALVWATIPTRYDDFYWGNIFLYIKRGLVEFPRRLKLGIKNFSKYRNNLIDCTTRFNDSTTDRVVVAETNPLCIYPKEWFRDTIDIPFEGTPAMVPIDYDKILRFSFGDYMQLPPIEKRISGHEFVACWKKNK